MTWLVTGGAGYIGAHVVRALAGRDQEVVVLDDLSTGRSERVGDATLVVGSVADEELVAHTLRDHRVRGVIHIAARKQVGESVARPLWYYEENVEGMRRLLSAMVRTGVDRFVFSSSAATYGIPPVSPISEGAPCAPINPYGETKLVGEWMLRDGAAAHGLRFVSLRYFNVAGAGADDLGDPGVFNLIPLVFQAMEDRRRPKVFGEDYPTPDGTCIRDYVHVADLADAHAEALLRLDEADAGLVLNVGTGRGSSVREVLDTISRVTGTALDPEVVERRAGDPPELVAAVDAIKATLQWEASRGLEDMVSSAWAAWNHDRGSRRPS